MSSFTQSKLSKSEWASIEILLSQEKLEILKVIIKGYYNVNYSYNKTNSLQSYLKITDSLEMQDYLYNIYFSEKINSLIKKYNIPYNITKINLKAKINSADKIRITKNTTLITDNNDKIYEYIIINFIDLLFYNKKKNNVKWIYYYFTIHNISNNKIQLINKNIKLFITSILKLYENDVNIQYLIYNSVEFIEHNENIIKYADITLYEHQKQIFSIFRKPEEDIERIINIEDYKSKLVLYIAPTGTGKTMTPIGLSEQYRIIYVCASRHVGLALARASISINKKIAFAFGCNSPDDIRLHYFSAKEYTTHKRGGGIKKVDNSIGDKVEIIICDVKSYLPAMYYMLSFFDSTNIISYFDEPTIFLDYDKHELHKTIHNNWKNNLIPNVVLSSATLPKKHEIPETIIDFKTRFPNAEIHNIITYDCKKTIPLIDNNGYVTMPHFISNNHNEIIEMAKFCKENPTLLRYLDLNECVNLIKYMEEYNLYIQNTAVINDFEFEKEKNEEDLENPEEPEEPEENLFISINDCFDSIGDVNMKNIKMHYLTLLEKITETQWEKCNLYFKLNRTKFIEKNNNTDFRKINSESSSINTSHSKLSNNGIPIQKMKSVDCISKSTNSLETPITEKEGEFGIYVTTKDACTLCIGPTLYVTEKIDIFAQFCITKANIPKIIMDEIKLKILHNDDISLKIKVIEDELEDIKTKKENATKTKGTDDSKTKDKKKTKIHLDEDKDVGVFKLMNELENLQSMVKNVSLNDIYIPNKKEHLKKWTTGEYSIQSSFTSDISEDIVIRIMALDVIYFWKILLLLGIGVFSSTNTNIAYNEIMKELADSQRLYLIIASSDYIYGTNYQFCHMYIGNDLNLTQEKIIQSLGRVGRENIQQKYSIRFRNEKLIRTLFSPNEIKPEVINMNILFTSTELNDEYFQE